MDDSGSLRELPTIKMVWTIGHKFLVFCYLINISLLTSH
ncbi:hypothetical protein ZOSMA_310G00050 [Zostera marina]|uniref:Uncharacterized protein n=1 Tax=Zostera marina TaxID=29655 RepID=A0A0K9PBT9_ZOSMR|nr:hypothetical protein ZOSMA_310G00050 [Zostera marina]